MARILAGPIKPQHGRVVILYRMVPHYRLQLYQGLAELFDFTVVTSANPPNGTNMTWIEGHRWLKRYDFKWSRAGGLYGRVSPPTRRILRELRPELVITEGSLSTSATSDLLLHRLIYGWPKVLFWGHGWQMGRGFASLSDKLSQYGRLLPYSLADGHITYCGEGAAWLKKFLPTKPVHVARNTQSFHVDEDKLEDSILKSFSGSRPFTIIASGRLTEDKNFAKLVRLFSDFREKYEHSKLIIVGDGPDRLMVEAEAARLPIGAVALKGAVYDEGELQKIYEDADCAAYAGSVGLAVNHALAYGLPFVTFVRGVKSQPFHHPEYAYVVDGETGYRAGCERSFVSYLEKLYCDRELLVSMRRKSRAFYKKELEMESYVNDFSAAISYHIGRGNRVKL